MFNYHCHVPRESCWLQSIEYILEERKNRDLQSRIFSEYFTKDSFQYCLLLVIFSWPNDNDKCYGISVQKLYQ